MKERIVIDEDFYVKHFQEREIEFYEEQLDSGGNPEEWWHYKKEQVPENIEDIKTLLDNLKIVHKTFYTNEKDYKWTEKDKVKILRAIVIRLKLKDDGEFNENTITIDNENRISIEKFMFEGREFVDLQLSTTNQCWQIIKNLIGEE